MIETVHGNIHRIEVPLPNNPLKVLNAYCLTGGDRHLLIDTGFNRPECREALTAALRELGVDKRELDICITHRHADHAGLAPDLIDEARGVVWCSAGDGKAINDYTLEKDHHSRLARRMLPHGFTREELDTLVATHPAIRYSPKVIQFKTLRDGDILRYGGYALRVVSAPGHTPDQITLYEEEHKLYFSGDHILGDITPNIIRWLGVADSLGDYLRSLDVVFRMDISLTLPGHRSLVRDTRGRIGQIREHHERRLDEVRAILREGPLNAHTVASRMTWSMRGLSWRDFPVPQKWFATGEALAHLDRLVALNEAEEQARGESVLFLLK